MTGASSLMICSRPSVSSTRALDRDRAETTESSRARVRRSDAPTQVQNRPTMTKFTVATALRPGTIGESGPLLSMTRHQPPISAVATATAPDNLPPARAARMTPGNRIMKPVISP